MAPWNASIKQFVGVAEKFVGDRNLVSDTLTLGKTYTVEKLVVGDSTSRVYLKEFPGIHFNPVLFKEVRHMGIFKSDYDMESFDNDPPRIDSTSDERTTNNVMRHEYKVLNNDEKAQMKAVKDAGLAFHELIDAIGDHDRRIVNYELGIAKQKVEEAVMWAVKHITK